MSGRIVWRPHRRISVVLSRRFWFASLLLVALLAACALLAVQVGSSTIAWADIWAALAGAPAGLGPDALTVYHFRVPRIVGAAVCGALVAASGYLLQVVSRNALADAGILGISEGAIAAVVLVTLLVGTLPREVLALVSIVGAFATGLVVVMLARRTATDGGFILVGIAMNILLGALVTIVVVSGGIEQFSAMLVWSRGTLATLSYTDAVFLLSVAAPLAVVLLLLSRQLAPFVLGEEQARSTGHETRALALGLVLMAAALLAPVVATAGPVAFLGLMSAYFARRFVGERPAEVLVVAMLCGALLLMAADTAGRFFFQPVIIPAGILVSVLGVPAFLLVAAFSRHGR